MAMRRTVLAPSRKCNDFLVYSVLLGIQWFSAFSVLLLWSESFRQKQPLIYIWIVSFIYLKNLFYSFIYLFKRHVYMYRFIIYWFNIDLNDVPYFTSEEVKRSCFYLYLVANYTLMSTLLSFCGFVYLWQGLPVIVFQELIVNCFRGFDLHNHSYPQHVQ